MNETAPPDERPPAEPHRIEIVNLPGVEVSEYPPKIRMSYRVDTGTIAELVDVRTNPVPVDVAAKRAIEVFRRLAGRTATVVGVNIVADDDGELRYFDVDVEALV